METRKLKVLPLKNITPDHPPRPKRYVFAINANDYTNWTLANLKLGASEEFVYVQHLDDIRGLRNITYSVTELVEKSQTYHKAIKEVISIVNFKYADKIDSGVLPKVIQEMMNESPEPGKRHYFQVGDIVVAKMNYPPIQVEAGKTIGVVYCVLDGDPQVIFDNGQFCGWGESEHEDLRYVRHANLPHIENYVYKNAMQLSQHFDEGHFDAAFYGLDND